MFFVLCPFITHIVIIDLKPLAKTASKWPDTCRIQSRGFRAYFWSRSSDYGSRLSYPSLACILSFRCPLGNRVLCKYPRSEDTSRGAPWSARKWNRTARGFSTANTYRSAPSGAGTLYTLTCLAYRCTGLWPNSLKSPII